MSSNQLSRFASLLVLGLSVLVTACEQEDTSNANTTEEQMDDTDESDTRSDALVVSTVPTVTLAYNYCRVTQKSLDEGEPSWGPLSCPDYFLGKTYELRTEHLNNCNEIIHVYSRNIDGSCWVSFYPWIP